MEEETTWEATWNDNTTIDLKEKECEKMGCIKP
jgi:hypothetical protein